ncbi:hypothetical protein FRC17_001241 [Serendipita sp. 399]|nr:hypothetical protein FRC17_001241 [Serendipita sp. 399]
MPTVPAPEGPQAYVPFRAVAEGSNWIPPGTLHNRAAASQMPGPGYGLQTNRGILGSDTGYYHPAPYIPDFPATNHLSLQTGSVVSFPTGRLPTLERQYQAPITGVFAPSENFSMRTDDGPIYDESLPSAHPGPSNIENVDDTRGGGEEERFVLRYGGSGAWKCALCSKTFRRRQRAILHVLNKHNNLRIECKGACGIPDWYVEP